MKKFEQEIEMLRNRLVEMGNLAQSAVTNAIAALSDYKSGYARVQDNEDRLDHMQLEIDQEAVRLLTIYSPVAADLRFVLTVTHINTALERIGDQAIGLCHNIELASNHLDEAALPKLKRMGELAQGMVADAMQAFVRRDAYLARTTMLHDDMVDSMNDGILKELLSDEVVRDALTGPRDLAGALSHILIARSLERIADQATNICEEVVYMVEGDDIRHAHPPKPAPKPV